VITDDVLLRSVCVEDEVSVRDATVGRKMDMYNAEIDTTVRFIWTEIAGKLSLSNLEAGKFRLDESSVGENVSLHQASIDTTLQINGTAIERRCSLNDGTVDGKALFERTEIGGDIILNSAKLARSWGRVSFE
jgi:hypothetical protein